MFDPEIQQTLETLLTRSQAGDVKWVDSTSAGLDSTGMDEDYVVLMPQSAINVFKGYQGKLHVNFIDNVGNVLLSLEGEEPEDRELIKEIFISARKIALNVDEKMAEIKESLMREGVIGETKPRKFKEQAPF
jgi:hypothetical protein